MANIIGAVSAPTRRIDGGTYQAGLEAERLVAEARSQAREIAARADAEAACARERARAEGRDERLAAAGETLAWAAAERDRLLASAEPELVRLALGVAAKVLGREADRDGSAVALEMARRALAEARERTLVALRVHPLDLQAVRERETDLSPLIPRAKGIAWISDPAVGRGGVVVETENGSVDGRLASQLEVVRRLWAGRR